MTTTDTSIPIPEPIFAVALALAPTERAALADALLASLDRPDPTLDARWAEEAEARLIAHDAGQIETIDADEVFAEFLGP